MTKNEKIVAQQWTGVVVFCVVLAVALAFSLSSASCSPTARAVQPISSSHSQLTATDYDAAETAFSGGLAPMPSELQAAADRECQRLLDKRNRGRAFVYGLGGLTGAGGLATLMPKDVTDEERKDWDLALGLATLGTATATTILGSLVHAWTDEYETRCMTETPAVVEHPATDEVDPTAEVDGGVN